MFVASTPFHCAARRTAYHASGKGGRIRKGLPLSAITEMPEAVFPHNARYRLRWLGLDSAHARSKTPWREFAKEDAPV